MALTNQQRIALFKKNIRNGFDHYFADGVTDAVINFIEFVFDNSGSGDSAKTTIFQSQTARDTFFQSHPDFLETGMLIIVQLGTTASPNIRYQIWTGGSDLTSYDPLTDGPLWTDGGIASLSSPQTNVLSGLISTSDDYLPIKSGNTYVNSPIRDTGDRLVSTKPIESTQTDTFYLGEGTAIGGSVKTLSVRSLSTDEKAIVQLQKFTDNGFEIPVYYQTDQAQQSVQLNTGTNYMDSFTFSYVSAANQMIIYIDIETNVLSSTISFELVIRADQSDGYIIHSNSVTLTTDASGDAEYRPGSPIIIDNLTNVFFTVTSTGIKGGDVLGQFIPNFTLHRLILVEEEHASRDWVNTHINDDSEHNILTNPLDQTVYVDKGGVDTDNDEGFIKSPYLTVGKAISRASTSGINVVNINHGDYIEDITIGSANIQLVGVDSGEGISPSAIRGTVTLGNLSQGFIMANLAITLFTNNPALSDILGSGGIHTYSNMSFASADLDNVINITNVQGQIEFINCSINGRVNISGTMPANTPIIFRNQFNGTFNIINNSNALVFVVNCLGSRLENQGSGSITIIGNCRTSANERMTEVGSNISFDENPYSEIFLSANYVDRSNNQEVSGQKTFTQLATFTPLAVNGQADFTGITNLDGATNVDGVATFTNTMNINGTVNATSSSDFRIGASDRLRVSSTGAVLNTPLYLDESGTMSNVSGKVGIGSGANHLFTVRGNGDVTYLDNWRYISTAAATYTAQIYDRLTADTTSNNVQINLPATPGNNQPVEMVSKKGGNTLTVDGNGNNIRVYSSNGTLLGTDTSVNTTLNRNWLFRYITDAWELHT